MAPKLARKDVYRVAATADVKHTTVEDYLAGAKTWPTNVTKIDKALAALGFAFLIPQSTAPEAAK